MTRFLIFFALFLLVGCGSSPTVVEEPDGKSVITGTRVEPSDTVIFASDLGPEPRHEQIAQLVNEFIQKSHYLQLAVDDDLSSMILDRYIYALDNNRMYLRASDVSSFEVYRYQLDDGVKAEPLSPVFAIFEVYRSRVRERLNFALSQLEAEPDFSTQERYFLDREDQRWLQNKAQLDDLWRRRVKYDAMNLRLTEKNWTETQEILHKRYTHFLKRMDQIKSEEVFEIFMNVFTHTIDPHSSYSSPRSPENYRIQLFQDHFGVGTSLQINNDYLTVVKINTGGPAAIDGRLQLMDRITAVAQGADAEFVDVIGWGLDEVIRLIRGPADTVVRLQVLPADTLPGTPEKIISLTRNPFRLGDSGVRSEIMTIPRDGRDWSVGVIKVPNFYRDVRALSNGDEDYTSATKDVRRSIKEFEKHKIDGLIVDLRNNGGGHFTEATALSGLFIDNGPVVQFRNGGGRISRLDDPDPVPRVAYSGPLAVLVNRNSASASEIFAAAIQDTARGVIVGQKTFGMGTAQNLYSLDEYARKTNDSGLGQLTLTVGKFYRINGDSPQRRGVEPDIDLPSLIDADLVGEMVRETALSWDSIPMTKFRAGTPLTNTISTLTASHISRSQNDPDYQYLMEELQDVERVRARKSVSLNIDNRRAEREDDINRRLDRENTRRAALQLEQVETLEELDSQDAPDFLLEQVSRIVADMAESAD